MLRTEGDLVISHGSGKKCINLSFMVSVRSFVTVESLISSVYSRQIKTILQAHGEGVLAVGGRSGGATGARDETTHGARDHHGIPADGCELGGRGNGRRSTVGYGSDIAHAGVVSEA